MISEKFVDVLNEAFAIDPKALFALMTNKIPCSRMFIAHPHIEVDKANLVEEECLLGPLGLINGVLASMGEPTLALNFGVPDNTGRHPIIGFRLK
jgi:hypothetical protein